VFPLWQEMASVDVFPSLDRMPVGYWPVVIRDDIGIAALGVHLTRDGTAPFALVTYRPEDWTITLSHEIIELVVDPFARNLIQGPSPEQEESGDTALFLAEICDPCQGFPESRIHYLVNGIEMSDFVTPEYYTSNGPGRYSFNGLLTQPRSLLPGGYFTWQDPTSRNWKSMFATEDGTEITNLGTTIRFPNVHLRGFVDRAMTEKINKSHKAKKAGKRRRGTKRKVDYINQAHCPWWKDEIKNVLDTYQ
jgi:hypothetical protein